MKIAFLILNYNTASQTEKCIDAILKRNSEIDFKIGLLDNGSRDSSCAELVEKKYKTFVGGGDCSLWKAKKILALQEETILCLIKF